MPNGDFAIEQGASYAVNVMAKDHGTLIGHYSSYLFTVDEYLVISVFPKISYDSPQCS